MKKKSICDSCDAYPEDAEIVYGEECKKGYLTLENKCTCAGYPKNKN